MLSVCARSISEKEIGLRTSSSSLSDAAAAELAFVAPSALSRVRYTLPVLSTEEALRAGEKKKKTKKVGDEILLDEKEKEKEKEEL